MAFYEDYLRRFGLPPVMIGHDSGSRRRSAYNPYTVRVSEPESLGGDPIVERGTGKHAVGYNKDGFGLAYNAPVGSMPSPGVMSQLQRQVELENFRRGDVVPMDFRGHGEADYLHKTGQDPRQATATARDWAEASWRPYATALHDRSKIGVDPTGSDIRFSYDPATGANDINQFAVPGGFQGVGPAPLGMPSVGGAAGAAAGQAAGEAAGGGGFFGNLMQNPMFWAGAALAFNKPELAQVGERFYDRIYKQRQMERQEKRDAAQDRQFEQNYALHLQQFGLSKDEATRHAREFTEQQKIREEDARLRQAQEARQAETFGRERQQYDIDQKIWGDVFPGGQANLAHPLLKGATPAEALTIYGLGPTKGLDYLRQQQMAGFKNREELEQIERIREYMRRQRGGQPAAAAAPPPAALAGTVAGGGAGLPALPAELAPQDYSTPTLQSAPPNVAPLGPQPAAPITPPAPVPATRAAAPAPAAPAVAGAPAPAGSPYGPGVPAEPMITYGGRNMTLNEAREEAEVWRLAKRPNEVLEKAIAAAEKDAGVPAGVREDAAKTDQAHKVINGILDRYNKIIQRQPFGFNTGGFVGQSADRDSAMREYHNLILQAKQAFALGQISESDMKLASQLPNPELNILAPWAGSGWQIPTNLKERTQRAVDEMKQSMLEQRNIKAGAIGLPQEAPAPSKQEKAPESKYGPTYTIPGTTRKARRNLATGKIEEVD